MLDMIILSGRMVQVSTTVQSAAIMEPSSHGDDPIDAIIRELEPMMAYQRKAMMQAWQDRSVSKLNLVVLMLLENHGPMPMSRLAALVDVSLSNLTGIIDRMEQHALVERVRDDRDRRLVFVRATPTITWRGWRDGGPDGHPHFVYRRQSILPNDSVG